MGGEAAHLERKGTDRNIIIGGGPFCTERILCLGGKTRRESIVFGGRRPFGKGNMPYGGEVLPLQEDPCLLKRGGR